MRLVVAALALFLPLADAPLLAQTAPREKLISIGPMVGQPSGVTFKMFNQSRNELAWEAGLGWSQSGQDGLQFHAQHQWHLYEMKNTVKGIRTFYLGIGGRVKAVDGTRFGVRGSVGINYAAPKYQRRWEAFLELAPIVDVTPDTTTFLDAVTGFRFFVW
jgi:hypothetical protein